MHSRFHDALAHGLQVAVSREVPDGVAVHRVFATPQKASADWME
jgi:hypothetical protein